jgi:hypothetical protein
MACGYQNSMKKIVKSGHFSSCGVDSREVYSETDKKTTLQKSKAGPSAKF